MEHLTLLVLSTLVLATVQTKIMELPEYIGCGASIRGVPKGIINYPNARNHRYPKNADCTWNIILEEGARMILTFERYDILKFEDTLVIKNGEEGTIIGTYKWNVNGGKIPAMIESEGNEIFLHFTSDDRQNGKGFKLKWERMPAQVSESGDNQCMANATDNSVLWEQIVSSEMAIKTTVNEAKDNVIEALTLKIQALNLELGEVKKELQEISNAATSQSELQDNLLEDLKAKQDATQIKLDYIIELLMDDDNIVTEGPSIISTDSPVIPTEIQIIPTEEPPFIPTEIQIIPTEEPLIIQTTEENPIVTEEPSNGGSETGSDCNYADTYSEAHTMNLPPKPECLEGEQTEFKRTGATENEIKDILAKHNELRAKVANGLESSQPGATNMLEMVWNIELAEVAQAWAEQCNTPEVSGSHDKYENREICSRDYYVGQNIAFRWGYNPSPEWNASIQAWYDEVADMPLSHVSSFNSYHKVIGHYTQVVWADTHEVGCGSIQYVDTWFGKEYPESKIYVCNYGPAGNFRNQPVYEIDEGAGANSNCPNGPSAKYPGLCATPPVAPLS